MRNLTPAELETKFPKLHSGNYKHTSPATGRYNCVAFANDHERKWWQSDRPGGMFYWPPKTPDTIEGWVAIFTRQGYLPTASREIEPGFEKIAIYVDLSDMSPSHVAKSNGKVWKSKLGRLQDIEHSSLDPLEGDNGYEYGIVDRILKRKLQTARSRVKRKS
jgi:hypothetical protein